MTRNSDQSPAHEREEEVIITIPSLTSELRRAYNGLSLYSIKGGETQKNPMSIKFYDVKLRKEVQIPESDVQKVEYKRETKDGKTQIRYALRAKTSDARNLTKFVSKVDYDKLS